MAADFSFKNVLCADASTDEDTTGALDEKGLVQLITGVPEESEDADDTKHVVATMPSLNQLMDAFDILRHFWGSQGNRGSIEWPCGL